MTSATDSGPMPSKDVGAGVADFDGSGDGVTTGGGSVGVGVGVGSGADVGTGEGPDAINGARTGGEMATPATSATAITQQAMSRRSRNRSGGVTGTLTPPRWG